MTSRRGVWLLVLATYGLTRLGVRELVMGAWAIDPELLTDMLVVPIAQVAVLELIGRLLWKKVWLEDPREHR
jgi:hypothetical protein